MRHCKNCGELNEETYTFCSSCGNRLISEKSQETAEQNKGISDNADASANSADVPFQEENPEIVNDTAEKDDTPSGAESGETQPAAEESQPAAGGAQPVIPPYVPPYAAQNYGQALTPNPVIAAIRKAGSSNLFLMAVIFFTLAIFLSMLAALFPTSIEFDPDIENVVREIGYRYDIDLIGMAREGELSPNIAQIAFSNLFGIITAIGLWMFYSASKKPGIYSTTGLKVIKTINIIKTVILCVVFGVLEILMMIAIASLPSILKFIEQYNIDWFFSVQDIDVAFILTTVLITMIIIFAVCFILALIYLLFITGTINTVKNSITYGVASDKVSIYVVVINFISAASMLFISPGSLINGNIASVLATVANGVFLVLISVCILSYRKTMKQMILMQQLNIPGQPNT